MSFSGDIGRVHRLANAIGQELPEVPSRVARVVADSIARDIQDEFDGGHDPYGTDWNELADSTIDGGRTPPPLTDTTAMRQSLSVRPTQGAGVLIEIDHPAAFHQRGFKPHKEQTKRPILPTRGIPDNWDEIIVDACDAEFQKVVA